MISCFCASNELLWKSESDGQNGRGEVFRHTVKFAAFTSLALVLEP